MSRRPNGQFAPTCDLCLMPDPYAGQGDGIGSCDCPRCEGGCGFPEGSDFCPCPDWDDGEGAWPDEDDDRAIQTLNLPEPEEAT